MSETKRVNRFHALATAAYMRELADHGALTPEESSWLMGARDVIEALVGERDAAEARATPPDAPVVWIARDGLRRGGKHSMFARQPTWDADEEIWKDVPDGVWCGPLLIEEIVEPLGLAPGACQRFRLAPMPEGETC